MKISEIIEVLKEVQESVGDKEIGIKTINEEGDKVTFHDLCGVTSSGFEGVNFCSYEDN